VSPVFYFLFCCSVFCDLRVSGGTFDEPFRLNLFPGDAGGETHPSSFFLFALLISTFLIVFIAQKKNHLHGFPVQCSQYTSEKSKVKSKR